VRVLPVRCQCYGVTLMQWCRADRFVLLMTQSVSTIVVMTVASVLNVSLTSAGYAEHNGKCIQTINLLLILELVRIKYLKNSSIYFGLRLPRLECMYKTECVLFTLLYHMLPSPEPSRMHGLGMRYSLPFQHKAGRNANEDETGLNYT